MVTLRGLAKTWAYRCGAMKAYHSQRNADTLTVVMFHRVLPAEEIILTGADVRYTVTPQFLSECVEFLREHYEIVSLEDLRRSREREKRLPRNAALITFDDGWYDNLIYAAPTLKGVPWVLFASTDAMLDADCWWQETLLWALRSGAASKERLWQIASTGPTSCSDKSDVEPVHALLLLYASISTERRWAILAPYRDEICKSAKRPMMLAPEDLLALGRLGVSVGAHGASHLPLPLLADPEADLREARDMTLRWTQSTKPLVMSFPHGRYSDRALQAARSLGYSLLFSSDAKLNPSKGGWVDSDLIGRIPIDMHDVGDGTGRVVKHKLAAWLFLRQIN